MKIATALTLTLFLTLASVLHGELIAVPVDYQEGETTLEGFLAYSDKISVIQEENPDYRVPLVLIAHNWMGLQDYEQSRARQLADLGFVAFAVDVYGKGVRPANRDEAAAESGKYKEDRALLRKRMQAALAFAKEKYDHLVDPEKVGVIGYCFGGMAALELARDGADVQAVVSFHGSLDNPSPEDAKNIQAEILICHGAADPYVPAEDLEALQARLDEAGVSYTIAIYSDAVHSFTEKDAGDDTSSGAAYNERADKRSWAHMKVLFHETLGGPGRVFAVERRSRVIRPQVR